MSQHDYIIDNASGAAVRADLNLALQALASLSSGATAPSTTYAYQLWADTANSLLKIRNGANNAWVTLGDPTTIYFGFRPLLVSASDPSANALAYQLWADTANSLLKIRNAANSAWITIGDPSAANLALLPLTGGSLSGFLSSSNTDYWKMPVGTTAQRPGSPANGMIRFNSDLACFEGYNAAWSTLGGSGGGGSLEWLEDDLSPEPSVDSAKNRVYAFANGLGNQLFTVIKVPNGYTTGGQIKLRMPFYGADNSGTKQMNTQATLIRVGTDLFTSTTNQRTSTNSTLSMTGKQNIPQLVTFDLTDSTGKINSVAVSAGDLILVKLYENGGSATSDLMGLVYAAELTFQG